MAAQSHVQVSFQMPMFTAEVDGVGVLNIMEAIRLTGQTTTQVLPRSTSELYGEGQEIPQSETRVLPAIAYAVAKLMGYWAVVNYRESYDMFACNGILFNHESPRRGETFVTRKITLAVANIKAGNQKCLYLGNLDAQRDWGHARDYVECMWKILQQDVPEDYVVATGEMTTVREFAARAFKHAGMELEFKGEGVEEHGVEKATGKTLLRVHPRYFRPAEVEQLLGNPAKALEQLKWNPRQTSLQCWSRRWWTPISPESKTRTFITNDTFIIVITTTSTLREREIKRYCYYYYFLLINIQLLQETPKSARFFLLTTNHLKSEMRIQLRSPLHK